MQIYINKASASNTPNWKLAALKQGTSFEYVSENRLFSGSDGYTLTITFPLKDCPQNQAIFCHINRADVAAQKVIFDCEIRDKSFYKFGCITITEINEAEVKSQFLDGRSEQNFDKTLDKIYIDRLDLGMPTTTYINGISPIEAWKGIDFGYNGVALPWVNDASGNLQNCAVCNNGSFAWHEDTKGLSWQPYLLYITKKICEQIGYSYDFAEWEATPDMKYLLICNALPYAWFMPNYAYALPHWSVEEYFAKLELFMGCEFDFDHRSKCINFAFSKDIVLAKNIIRIDDVLDEHSEEIKIENDKCDYSETKNLAYKHGDHAMAKFYSCHTFLTQYDPIIYDTLNELITALRSYEHWLGGGGRPSTGDIHSLYYAADVDCYFVIRTVSREPTGNSHAPLWNYKCILQPVNMFGPRIVDDNEDASTDDIEFVPACINYTDDDFGEAIFLSFNSSDGSSYEYDENAWVQPIIVNNLLNYNEDTGSAYFDSIFIAWWNGVVDHNSTVPPHPYVENIVINKDWSGYQILTFSLRINNKEPLGLPIDPKKKTTFKFLADSIPDVRAPFIIRGKRYVCEKLTATFTESGMSQLIKFVGYPVKEGQD